MPEIKLAAKAAIRHKDLLDQSPRCGCYYCKKVYETKEIKEWTDKGQTAICPHCGIDAVLPEAAGYELTEASLDTINKFWFRIT